MATTTKFSRTYKIIVTARKHHNSPKHQRRIEGDMASPSSLSHHQALGLVGTIIDSQTKGLAAVDGIAIYLGAEKQG